MTRQTQTLADLLSDSLPETGTMINGTGAFMEAMDPTSQQVWMTLNPVSEEDYAGWKPEPPLRKVGIGTGVMDGAGFRHDPLGPAHPVQTRMIGGHACLHVARPADLSPPEGPGLPIRITVTKGHTVGYDAGRTIRVMSLGTQHFVELIGLPEDDKVLKRPDGAKLHDVRLDAPWIVELPCPTTTFFWLQEKRMRSFQGPVTLPDEISI
ncbi:MAG: hypothetical protein ACON4C_00650 [Henriciella sp.]